MMRRMGLFLGGLVLGGTSWAQEHSGHHLLTEGRQAYTSLQDAAAIHRLEEFLVNDPYHSEARELHARALVQTGRFADAVASLELLPELSSNARLVYCEALAALPDRRAEAFQILDELMLADPGGILHRITRARCLLAAGRAQEALTEIWSARQMVVNNMDVDLVQGRILEGMGRLPEAEELYLKIITERGIYPPADPHLQKDAMYGLARISMARGQYEQAQDYYKQIVDRLPDDAYAHFHYSVALGLKDRFELALTEMERARELAPEDPFLCFRLGDLYRSQRKVDEAIEQFQALRELSSDPLVSHLRLAELYLEKEDEDEALRHAEIALKLNPESADVQETAGTVFEARGEVDRAIQAYDKAFQLSPLKYNAMYRLALLLRSSEEDADRDRARAFLKRHQKIEPEWPNIIRARTELDVNPRNPEVLARIAYFLNRAEEFDPAWDFIQRSLRIDPNQPRTHVFAGYIANNRGQSETALQHFEIVGRLLGPESMDPQIQSYIDALKGGENLGLLKGT